MKFFLRLLGSLLVKYLTKPSSAASHSTHPFSYLQKTILPCDVLLVEGKERFSTAIKYLTQSNWSHSAIYIGDGKIIEADLKEGVIECSIKKYKGFHTRICRPINLTEEDKQNILTYCKNEIGHQYDLKNVFDLARYLFPTPPVPTKWRKKVLRIGSGDPTRAICSTMVAMAFQKIKYPILPTTKIINQHPHFSMRHYSLFTPSDFDRSPYFRTVKPTIEMGFDYKTVVWTED